MGEWFGLSSDDDEDSEHYLSDKFPYNPDTEMRGEVSSWMLQTILVCRKA
jgi:hypothetical protein